MFDKAGTFLTGGLGRVIADHLTVHLLRSDDHDFDVARLSVAGNEGNAHRGC